MKFEISKKGNEKIKFTGKSYEISRLVSALMRLSQGRKSEDVELKAKLDPEALYKDFRDALAKSSDITQGES